ncbi:VOC family protein [Salinibacterium sp. NK8237]|uniref:VOC family protein n=1 Tax=Salinibacterium sp. NK8237 TaxID=2792038 RepID=UPI0018CE2F63|nr:VOC family protein [Salinibacterium sp. NK8237]MBH0130101.1 VOC family protein [Salinibacterium sp. NK8237]
MSASPSLNRTLLSHVALTTPDVEGMAAFYNRHMGLQQVVDLGSPHHAFLGYGQGHHALELIEGPVGLHHIAFEVGDEGGHEALADRQRARGINVRELGDEAGTLEVADPDGNLVRLHGPISRSGEHTADPGRRPLRIQHATFSTHNMEPMVEFYVGLGFRVSDRMGEVFTWLRSTVDHHSIAIVKGPTSSGLDHYSWDLAEWEDFKSWSDRLTDNGVQIQWGPGRHGPGGNLFLFFDDPDGNHIELSAEMERFFDDRADYQPRVWEPGATTVNLWGGQVPSWRAV